MLTRFRVLQAFPVGVIALIPCLGYGQNYPNKPIRIVTAETGGSLDFVARLVAEALPSGLGQRAIVENRGIIAIETVAKAPPDGYTVLFYGSSLWLTALMRDNTSWDALRDFTPISVTHVTPNVVAVHPSLPVRTVRELIALAKSRPGNLNYSTGSPASPATLSAELFNSMAGVNIVRVPYKGTGPALTALISGEVQLMFPVAPSVAPHLRSGRLKALAVTTAQPSALTPGVPTVAASGLPGYEAVSMFGAFAPAKTPEDVLRLLNQEIVRVLNAADVKDKFLKGGVEAVSSSRDELAAIVKSEVARMGKVIRNAGLRAD